MSRSPAKSGKAIATKLLKEKWLIIVQSTGEKGENEIGGFSTITVEVLVGCWSSGSGKVVIKAWIGCDTGTFEEKCL